ncbi:hypothetical protein Q4561_11660 [Alteromonas sp. 1_MG-2023]|uniref:hypothetical protein n=1 Tax=Alteromonas sp. 1_MG-2023 TaxID=3062669 RepID=UPI0026E41C7F|nr:hypothetical protein [Alteromonas sp. 1_MG-2023]MDO6567716.1 hypothetical protein [Alteromonas sp. 1_MG-2023]
MKWVKFTSLFLLVVVIVIAMSYEKIITGVLLPQYIDWAYETDIKGQEIGTPLDNKELLLAAEIGIVHPEKVRIVYVDEVPYPYENFALKVFGEAVGLIGEGIINNAQVFGYSIYSRKDFKLNRPKLAHELVHVLQIERSSLDNVINQHFSDMAEYGYGKAPLEVEAFKANKKYSASW